MSNQNSKHGKREASGQPSSLARYWAQYKNWLAGLSEGQRIRYRALQAATIVAIIIIVVYLILSAWIKVPDLPVFGQEGDVSFEGAETPNIASSGRKEGVYTFLLAGKDVVSGSTDTMLLISYDTKEKTIQGMNLPRDTMINTSAASKRLNSVYTRNRGSSDLSTEERVAAGMAALKEEVANLTGIMPDFYILVEWEAIGKLVDALGGVEFEVPFDMDYDDNTPGQDLHIHQEAGLRLLNGDDAMQVIRFRKNNDGSHSGGDVGRLAIQQDFLKAVAKKCLQPATFLKVPELAKIFTENVETDLTLGNILAFAQLAYGMNADEGVSFFTAPLADSFLYKGASLVTLDAEELLEIVNNGMNPYLRDIQMSDLSLLVRSSNGSFYVTSGTLADSAMGQGQTASSKPVSDNEQPPEPIEPVDPDDNDQTEPEDGDPSQNGDTSQVPDDNSGETETPPDESQQPSEGGDSSQTDEGDPSQDENASRDGGSVGIIDPDQVLPDPNVNAAQDIGGETDEIENSVVVLPNRPVPVEQAA